MSTAVEAAVAELGALAQRDVPLGPMTTYRVGGSAAVFVRVDKADQLGAVARARAASALPMLVVGRGSNLLVANGGFDGIAVQLGDFVDRIDIDEHTSVVTAGAAVRLPVLARRTAAAGLAGFEWAVGVPGSIGGAVRMNAGGHGSDMAASLLDADVADLGTDGTVHRLGTDDLHLRFRGSGLTSTDAVVSARLRLRPGDVDASEAMVKEIVAWRRAHQPGGQNAGSVFVNPVPGEVSAGQLVDDCGLRGHRIGSAYVSEIHANFIQSDDAGSADDVVRLMRHVREVVLDRTGYALRSEIRLIGFGEPW
ncbi:MAG: UDP-N-acetylmuramate dehydrogenase [Actinomycetota bacterium]